VNAAPKIIIDNEAKIALGEAYEFIKKDSFQNAEKVRNSGRIKIFLFARMRFLGIE